MRDEDEYWNPIMETMRRSELEELQWKKIKSIITYAYRNSPFYHEMFSKEGIKPEDIKTKEEFQNKIPLFRKDKVRKLRAETGDPFAKMLTVPYEVLASFHTSTGTTGVPTFTALSENDIKAATEPLTRIGWMWKIRPGMRLLCAAMLDGFWHWWSVFLGHCVLTNLGVNSQLITYNFLIPLFGLPTSKTALGKFRADWVLFTHASALAVLNECTRLGVEPKEIIPGVKYACSAGEAASTHQRETFLEKFGTLDWFGGWGCSDPYTMTSDCYAHIGYHVFLDYWSLELVDPETDELLPPGERGEIVSTNLWQESLPYVRFGTEDFGELVDESCECGRTHPMVRVFDRTAFVIKVAGKRVTPMQLRLIMEKYPETRDASFNIIKYSDKMDTFKIKASYKEDITKDPEGLKDKIVTDIKKELGLDAELEWVPYEQLEKVLFKIARIVDLTKE